MSSPSLAPTEQAPDSVCGACPADCLDACFNEAIVATGDGVRIQGDHCAGCGACIPACAFGFIRLQAGVARILFPKNTPRTLEPAPQAPQWSE